jgi:hypothetical protein
VKVCFFRGGNEREWAVCDSFLQGVIEHGDLAQVRTGMSPDMDHDVGVVFGVKQKDIFWAHKQAGQPIVMLDKGYSFGQDRWAHIRCSVNSLHPVKYVASARNQSGRFKRWGVEPKPWRQRGRHIVIAGSSEKYHRFNGIDTDPNRWAFEISQMIAEYAPGRQIIYRPKPSWKGAAEFDGATFHQHKRSLLADLEGCHVMVTHGSNAAVDAVLAGVPCIILGDGVAGPVSSARIRDVETPLMVNERDRLQWLWNLAHCQWTLAEMADGLAWDHIKPQLRDGI